MPQEFELKSVVHDIDAVRRRIEALGAALVFEGRLEDRRYDYPDHALELRDEVLRVRVYRAANGDTHGSLDWKGPAMLESGYKVREEISTAAGSPDTLAVILERLGYIVSRGVDREIAQYELDGAIIRFERYPRMDDLVEVEGAPDAIERGIKATGLPRAGFSTDALREFVARYELRTGTRAVLADSELTVNAAESPA
jgi:adenylate cyclase class IV